MREFAHMLKAIHARERRQTAVGKAEAVVTGLRAMRLNKAAGLVEEKIQRTDQGRRGAFPDGQFGLCLAAARLKHVAGTQWSTRKYMDMEPLREMNLQYNGAAVAWLKVRKILDTTKTKY